MDILKYKNYEGTAELDMDRFVCRGKILFINDLITYEASSPLELQKEFEAAVDDYLETCIEIGRDPQKPLRGMFNVRVSPELHKSIALRAKIDNVPLNDVVVRALDAFVCIHADINHNHNHNVTLTLEIPESSMERFVSSTSDKTEWRSLQNVH